MQTIKNIKEILNFKKSWMFDHSDFTKTETRDDSGNKLTTYADQNGVMYVSETNRQIEVWSNENSFGLRYFWQEDTEEDSNTEETNTNDTKQGESNMETKKEVVTVAIVPFAAPVAAYLAKKGHTVTENTHTILQKEAGMAEYIRLENVAIAKRAEATAKAAATKATAASQAAAEAKAKGDAAAQAVAEADEAEQMARVAKWQAVQAEAEGVVEAMTPLCNGRKLTKQERLLVAILQKGQQAASPALPLTQAEAKAFRKQAQKVADELVNIAKQGDEKNLKPLKGLLDVAFASILPSDVKELHANTDDCNWLYSLLVNGKKKETSEKLVDLKIEIAKTSTVEVAICTLIANKLAQREIAIAQKGEKKEEDKKETEKKEDTKKETAKKAKKAVAQNK